MNSGWMKKILAGLVAVGLVVALGWRQREIQQVRRENQELGTLPNQQPEVGALASRSELEAEMARYKQVNSDLPRLRNDVRQLRRKMDEASQVQQENAQLRTLLATGKPSQAVPGRPEKFIPFGDLRDLGNSTPEALVCTTFWALVKGETNRLMDCIYVDPANRSLPFPSFGLGGELAKRDTNGFPGFGIIGQKNVSPDEVVLALQAAEQGSVMELTAIRVGNQWKIKLP